MFADIDWCNIYHVCIGSRDNIFLCPPGTIFNDTKQGCMDRFDGTNCNGTRSYYKPTMKRQKRDDLPIQSKKFQSFVDLKQYPQQDIPYQWKKSYQSREVFIQIQISISILCFFSLLVQSKSFQMATTSLIINNYFNKLIFSFSCVVLSFYFLTHM
jgi:hypothetical protein